MAVKEGFFRLLNHTIAFSRPRIVHECEGSKRQLWVRF